MCDPTQFRAGDLLCKEGYHFFIEATTADGVYVEHVWPPKTDSSGSIHYHKSAAHGGFIPFSSQSWRTDFTEQPQRVGVLPGLIGHKELILQSSAK